MKSLAPHSSWHSLALALTLVVCPACRCDRHGTVAASVPIEGGRFAPSQEDPVGFELATTADAGPTLPPCTLDPPRWLIPPSQSDAAVPLVEVTSWGLIAGHPHILWLDHHAAALTLWRDTPSVTRFAVDLESLRTSQLVAAGSTPLVVAVSEQQGGREQVVLQAQPSSMVALDRRSATSDDSLAIASCPVQRGALIAWDEVGANGKGTIVVQRWSAAERPVASAPRVVSAPSHDAADAVLMALPGGGALVAYLALSEVAVETANQSAADIVLRALDDQGQPQGEPITITPAPRTRFAVALAAQGSYRWVAWRMGLDSDHEGRGDGGQIAAVALGPDLRPVHSPEYLSAVGGVTSGSIAILAAESHADVYWTERRADELVTLRRPMSARGTVETPLRDEPALRGALPIWGAAGTPTILLRGPHGEPGLSVAHCPL
ncbi:MAG: hypothetical protein Q8Q09_29720 [Deltaproteobacteria bacterium]|nr:hypothetical protein [Deltaproteobacteria bacterium]